MIRHLYTYEVWANGRIIARRHAEKATSRSKARAAARSRYQFPVTLALLTIDGEAAS